MNWQTVWVAQWGALPDPRARAIESVISECCNGLQPDEMDKTVAYIANGQDSQGKAPTPQQISAIIIQRRKQARGIDTSEPYEVTQARRGMRTMPPDGLTRWDAICLVCERFGRDMADRVIKSALDNGGLTIPWWASKTILHTRQEPKPRGVNSSIDLLAHNKAVSYA